MSGMAENLRLVPLPKCDAARRPAALVEAGVLSNAEVAPGHLQLRLAAGPIAHHAMPGQFVMLSLVRPGESAPVLPRPMALYDWDDRTGTVDVVYRVVGRGTAVLAGFRPGESIVTVGPLGRPFTLKPQTRRLLLIGRGIGVCSLTALARAAAAAGVEIDAIVSARTEHDLIGLDFFRALGACVWAVHDADGSSAVERLETLLSTRLRVKPVEQIAVCGSERLLGLAARLGETYGASVEVSLEAHMACGIGYCHGCASGQRGLAEESPLICIDGPVFVCESAS